MNKISNYSFDVETLEAGQRGKYQDSYYHYKVTTKEREMVTLNFCVGVLQNSSLREHMTTPFDGERLLFKKITNNNEGKSYSDEREPETYEYKVRLAYTG